MHRCLLLSIDRRAQGLCVLGKAFSKAARRAIRPEQLIHAQRAFGALRGNEIQRNIL